jgi:septum formation protein
MIEPPTLILASGSPRRAEILRTIGWPFEARPANIDETRRPDEDPLSYVQRLAREKAEAAAAYESTERLVVGADTIVLIDDEILGKPRDQDDARRMLGLLSGKWHAVLTGMALLNRSSSKLSLARELTEVKFAALREDEIEWYIGTGEPMDKAGAYAIQGLGARFVEGIKGDYYNVVGLPVRLLYAMVNGAA